MAVNHSGGFSLEQARDRYLGFLDLCRSADGLFRLTPASDTSHFAACFWIFGMHLLRQDAKLAELRDQLAGSVRREVRAARMEAATTGLLDAKPYRQLLAFSLSALSMLGALSDDPLEDLVAEQLPQSVACELASRGSLAGRAQSGNQAMFMAVFLLHARDYLGLDTQASLDQWVALHLEHMNCFGFWGSTPKMTHLQFQNGYHQHEILEYLGVDNPCLNDTLAAVGSMADKQGHFAPYPGGGGCYDYDAVFMLTPHGRIPGQADTALLRKTVETLLSEQRSDGGFAESLYIRPRSPEGLGRFVARVLDAIGNGPLFRERLRYAFTLQRPKHDHIMTHWSEYPRRWDESDLWDGWFRMLALARIDVAFHPEHADRWGFVDFPGIGFHPSLKQELLQP